MINADLFGGRVFAFMSNLALLSDQIYMFPDGSHQPVPHKLGAAWVTALDQQPIDAGRIEIAQEAPSANYALFAEIKAAIYALRSIADDKTINVVTDRPEIITSINRNIVPPYIRERQPELVNVFGTLLHEVSEHKAHGIKVWATLPKFLSHHAFAKAACIVAHNLAADASGANSHKPENWWSRQIQARIKAPDFLLRCA